ncbi:hypothetical protein LCGC14_0584790 [marine sediment metagenome]|uniref:C-type lysozyme inhibitor domain-containing protein n=1 Tax=marine sediment metagenome TaxID=412755 RepID=A0A0F9RF66_9ZZZZ|nr:hypothetical protein [Methylophaga sp.]HEC60066.1 hypothetical protein [Methylophaga sp.]
MKALTALAFTSTILISACALQHEQYPPATTPTTTNEYHYHCESGKSIVVSYIQQDSATVQYQNEVYTMQIAISASGTRYVGGKLVWWNKGGKGTLYQHNTDGNTGEALEVCTSK